MRMARKSVSLLVLGLSCFLSLIAFSDEATFDYFAFVQQYPPASCNKAGLNPPCPTPVPKRFTIHGLWPQLNSGALIVNCPGPAFDINKIKGLVGNLNIQWPNVMQRNANERFWQHEWTRHGTCWTNDQQKYFKKALDLRQKNDLLKILNGAGLGPSLKNRLLQQIQSALQNKIQGKVQPALRCINSASGGKQLAEIVLCYKTDAVTPQNCPARLTNCPAQFLWLPRNSSAALPIDDFAMDDRDFSAGDLVKDE